MIFSSSPSPTRRARRRCRGGSRPRSSGRQRPMGAGIDSACSLASQFVGAAMRWWSLAQAAFRWLVEDQLA